METSVKEIRMGSLRFVPVIQIGSATVTYKELYMEFESLPIELQEQIRNIAVERVASQLERSAQYYERANNASTRPASAVGMLGESDESAGG